jgi:hypothetical protein
MWRAIGLAAVAAMLLAGCSAGQTGPEPAQPDAPVKPSGPPLSAWQQVLSRIGPDGVVDVDTARQAFAMAVAPLPGVDVPDPGAEIRCGTLAIQWLFAHRDELTPEQLAAARKAVSGPFPGAKTVTVSAPVARGRDVPTALHRRAPDMQDLSVMIDKAAAQVDAAGDQQGPAVMCRIIFTERVLTMSPQSLLETVNHEVFHCFAGRAFPTIKAAYAAAAGHSWLTEGLAEWVGNSMAGSDEGTPYHWGEYLLVPDESLFARSYDAMGFFAHLAESGVDPWSVAMPMLKALNGKKANATAFNLALGGKAADVLGTWPSGYARGRLPGKPWNTTGPGITADKPVVGSFTVGNGDSVTVSAGAAANAILRLNLTADVTTFTVSDGAHGRLGQANNDDKIVSEMAGDWCTREDQQRSCPQGSVGAGADIPMSAGEVWLALTGGLKTATVKVTGQSVSQLCARKPATRQQCAVGTWTTTEVTADGPGLDLTGGAGVKMKVGSSGIVTVTFDGMAPIGGLYVNEAVTAGVVYTYEGSGGYQLRVAESGKATIGSQFGKYSASGKLTVARVTVPFELPLSTAPAAGQASGAVDTNPFGGKDMTCDATTLTQTGTGPHGQKIVWTWRRD